jgi:hypothetical protein
MSASYCFVLHGRCIAPRVRDSIFAEHQRPQVAAFMECVVFMQPRWPSTLSPSPHVTPVVFELLCGHAQVDERLLQHVPRCEHHPRAQRGLQIRVQAVRVLP